MGAARISHPSGVTIILQTESHALQTADKEMLPQQAGEGGTEGREVEKTAGWTESKRTEEQEQRARGTRRTGGVQGERFLHCHLLHLPHSCCCSSPPTFTSPFHTHPIPPSPAPSAGGRGQPVWPVAAAVWPTSPQPAFWAPTHTSTRDRRRTDRWEKRGGKKGEIKMRDKRHVKKKQG